VDNHLKCILDERFSGHWNRFTVTTLTLRDVRKMRLRKVFQPGPRYT
jgi:hypothetical protein